MGVGGIDGYVKRGSKVRDTGVGDPAVGLMLRV